IEPTRLARQDVLERGQIIAAVHRCELGIGRDAHRHVRAALVDPRGDERVANRLSARGPLGMPRRCAVLDEDLVEDVAEHQSRSDRAGRDKSNVIASRTGLPSWMIAYIASTIGASTPIFAVSSFATFVVFTPSATWRISARISAIFLPWPSASPTRRL